MHALLWTNGWTHDIHTNQNIVIGFNGFISYFSITYFFRVNDRYINV